MSTDRKPKISPWAVVPLVIGLLLLDVLPALRGAPLLVLTIVIAFFAGDGVTRLLRRKELQPLAQVSALVATLMLLFTFCSKQDPPQLLLLLITGGVVVAILFLVLAFIGDVSKRGIKGLQGFLIMAGFGLLVGGILTRLLIFWPRLPGGGSTAAP